jgi:hypothetical protein
LTVVASAWGIAVGLEPPVLTDPAPKADTAAAAQNDATPDPAITAEQEPASDEAENDEREPSGEQADDSAAESDEPKADSPEESPEEPAEADEDQAETTSPNEGSDADLPTVGHPGAPGMMVLLEREAADGLKTRRIEANFARFRSYAGWKLDNTAGRRRTSEVTGNCRLNWYDHLLRNPMKAPAEAEQFTRHQALAGGHDGFDVALRVARSRMDCGTRAARSFRPVNTPQEALDVVVQALGEAQSSYHDALSPLKRSEIGDLQRNLYPVLTSQVRVGHALSRPGTGRRLCDLLEKLDRSALHSAADALAPLANPELLRQLALLNDTAGRAVTLEGATGRIATHLVTPAGNVLIGGRGSNTYDLDSLREVSAVIDLGGNDVYREGSVSFQRPLLVVIDLEGDDVYQASKPGVQGSAVLGVAMLVDAQGDDTYRAQDVAQGSCLGGVGILLDRAGNDSYRGLRRVQGQAIGGVGMLLDRGGNDRYHAAMWAQGFGGPLGFGALDDVDGQDHYYSGGLYPDSYEETPGYEGWGQGVGSGLRGVSNGGIGVILDGGGDDVYEYDYLSHGGGYWLGIGFARDFGGNDRRLAATSKAYNGGKRYQRRYQRFGSGFGCHYALGFCFDDQGDDAYHGTIMGVGFAWDCSVGVLCDFGGNDRYETTSRSTQGSGAQAGLGILYEYDGDDVYRGYAQGYASRGISYHTLPRCGGNFSFVVDYGGTDQYGCRAKNNTYNRRGSSGGFLIDRPSRSDAIETAERPSETATTGS